MTEEIQYKITEAIIKDDVCNYKYEVTEGTGAGDVHKVTNTDKLIKESMRDAFAKLNVHLACIDDSFKLSGIEIDDIDKFHDHELTDNYNVQAIRTGTGEAGHVILTGTKYISTARDRIKIETPKILVDDLSSYKWYNELKEAAAECCREVELYKEGNFTTPEVEVELPKMKQLTIGDAIADFKATGATAGTDENGTMVITMPAPKRGRPKKDASINNEPTDF